MIIGGLYPPDSQYEGTRVYGRELMDNTVGNKLGCQNWRDLPDEDLINLAKANLIEAGEDINEYFSPSQSPE